MKKLLQNWYLVVAFTTLILAGCGGSSGGSVGPAPSNPAPPPPTPVPNNQPATPLTSQNGLVIYGDQAIVTGQSTGFAVVAESNQNISSIEWQQLSGPDNLSILASHTQAIGFDATVAGEYSLQITATTASSQALSTVLTFNVEEASSPDSSIRLDHQATERGRVSLRTTSNVNKSISSITWTQIAGPQAQNILYSEASGGSGEPDNQVIVFNAPAVDNDSAIVFEATTRYTDGTESSDKAVVLVVNDEINDDGYFPNSNLIVTSSMFAFNSSSRYANALESCVYNNQVAQTCRFSQLPLIGQETENPTVQTILDRTLVSHKWMGERFEQYLRNSAAGPDMLLLLRATTAIVISYEVRPSFFWAATGAIYLDARNFWLTPEERDTLNEQRDFRSDFGNDLSFIIPWRYVKNNNNYPAGSYPIRQRLNRNFADLEASISWLMYHELGHANDFYPSTRWASMSNNDDPLSFFRANGATSDLIPVSYPLESDEMTALAQVSFAGETATSTQRAYQPDDIEMFFTADKAPAYYSYSTTREDFATLFERFMMAYRLNASADVAILEDPDTNPELMVTWGQRDRFNQEQLKPRVRFAVESVLPNLDVAAIQQAMPAPQLFDANKNWFDNLNLGGNSEAVSNNAESMRFNHPRKFDPTSLHGPDIVLPLPNKEGQ